MDSTTKNTGEREVILEVIDLAKTFRIGFWRKKVEAVKGVSFQVRRGEVFGLVGPNGAGKTTTIKMLTGLIYPSAGESRLFGESIRHVDTRRRLGYLPEGPYFYEHLTARELVHYYGGLHGVPRKVTAERAVRLLNLVGLDHAADRPIRKFSKGMRQRVGIAQALINDPELVILDEPQTGLDPVGRKEVRDIIFHLKDEGKTVFFTSHILPDVEAVCDRVAVLHQGELVEIGNLKDLTSQKITGYEILVRGNQVELAKILPEAAQMERRGDMNVVRYGATEGLDTLLQTLIGAGAAIHAVTPHEDNLEDVFMRDTGHTTADNKQEVHS